MGHRVFIAIGSNLGDRMANLKKAIGLVRESAGVELKKVSSFLETEPWGVTDQPPFINAAFEIETDLSPRELLNLLKGIESRVGKKALKRWGPREIDLDIVFYDDRVLDEEGLKVPHPYAHERAFVLKPLSEIAPGFVHPLLKKSISELLEELKSKAT